MSKWLAALVAGLIVLLGSLSLVVTATPSMFPVWHDEAEPVVVTPEPTERNGEPVPAIEAVDTIIAAMPATMSGMPEAATAPSLPVDNCVTPLVSRTRAWASGGWLRPSGVVVTVSVYPPGMGRKASACAEGRTVRRGDIVAVLDETRATADLRAVHTAMDTGTAQCADTSLTIDQSNRNPKSENYTGWVQTFTVEHEGTAPRMVEDVAPRTVEIPHTPTFPHAPQSLPEMPDPPQPVVAPDYPSLTRTFSAQVEDPVGPGCGWAFTGTTPPRVDAEALNQHIVEQTALEQTEIQSTIGIYNAALVGYDTARAEFDELNPAWEQWGREVDEIARKWDRQRRDWERYERDKAAYDAAVTRRDEFIRDQNAARSQYERDMQACQVMVTPPPVEVTVTPEPQPEPTESIDPETGETTTPEPQPEPTPTVEMSQPPPYPAQPCPERPRILDQSTPHVPAEPTPPRPS